MKAKEAMKLSKNDTYTTYPSGGGGWGDPMEREVDMVRMDVKNGLVSLENARKLYGVELKDDYSVNYKETARLRGGKGDKV